MVIYDLHSTEGSRGRYGISLSTALSTLAVLLFALGMTFAQAYGEDSMVSVQMMKEDFSYAVDRLERVHPLTVHGFSDEQRGIINEIQDEIGKSLRISEFFFLVNRLFHSFADAHTNLWPDWQTGLQLPMLWMDDGLYVLQFGDEERYFDYLIHNRFVDPTVDGLRMGDEVVSIGGRGVEQIFADLKDAVCRENEHFLRLFGQDMLVSQSYLDHYDLIENDKIAITIERNHHRQTVELRISVLGPRRKADDWIDYAMDREDNLAVLKLRQCIFDAMYRSTLRSFFSEVSRKGIQNIALDLRVNDGGDSQVVGEFIRYLNVESYRWYGAGIRYSKEVSEITGETLSGYRHYPCPVIRNDRVKGKDLVFDGNLYILTSKNTFSSANMFAVTIKDNRLGKVVGEPTGNRPTCYGNPLSFKMPNTNIYFRISYKQFLRPNQDANDEDSLYPDIEIRSSIDDIINGRDTQVGKLIKLIKNGIIG